MGRPSKGGIHASAKGSPTVQSFFTSMLGRRPKLPVPEGSPEFRRALGEAPHCQGGGAGRKL